MGTPKVPAHKRRSTSPATSPSTNQEEPSFKRNSSTFWTAHLAKLLPWVKRQVAIFVRKSHMVATPVLFTGLGLSLPRILVTAGCRFPGAPTPSIGLTGTAQCPFLYTATERFQLWRFHTAEKPQSRLELLPGVSKL